MSMARTARHPDFAAQLEAQARLYLSLARIRASPASDLTALLNEFNARQMRELRKSWEDEQAGPVPDRLAQLLDVFGVLPHQSAGAKADTEGPWSIERCS